MRPLLFLYMLLLMLTPPVLPSPPPPSVLPEAPWKAKGPPPASRASLLKRKDKDKVKEGPEGEGEGEGTGALVYDSSEVDDLFRMLDQFDKNANNSSSINSNNNSNLNSHGSQTNSPVRAAAMQVLGIKGGGGGK